MGTDEGLTSARPAPPADVGAGREAKGEADAEAGEVPSPAQPDDAASVRRSAGASRPAVEQTKDDTDEGWGEPGEDDASARWLRENRPPHWS